ncbi:hypothetical protein [Allocoleopsis franciscana]|uniref:Uncharacterized protein n=1 Tax=Allocoleopsis franciscana PCC 7113 TaxID=1173027 RepID=K9WNL1_9CYAN|nr:hypothetical protein [Allocoleopsis franciscana]AFZ21401.1 hypothetical protein Mic7113_5776 [Allocoleopsis franciscana PCC 7113]
MTIQTQRTSRFIDPWPYVALGAALLVFLALLSAGSFQKTLLSTTVNASEDEPVQLAPLTLRRQMIGALRVEVKALLPTNTWVTYEIQLLDNQGKPFASAIKQAWNESGTWYEDGESGSWQEEDVLGGLDVRAKQNETVTIAIAVLEYGNALGQELDQPVPFEVIVQNGAIDTRYLWAGLVGTSSLALVALCATPLTGKKAIAKTIKDSDPSDRATVGGAGRLVRVNVDVASDETSPPQLEVRLWLNDPYGEQIYTRSFPLHLSFKKEEGKIKGATGHLQTFFILEPRSSYGFHVEVLPDRPIDSTTLTVRDGTRTLKSVEVVKIDSSMSPASSSPQDSPPA